MLCCIYGQWMFMDIYIYTKDNGDSPGLLIVNRWLMVNGVNRTGDGVAEVQQYQYDLLRTFTLFMKLVLKNHIELSCSCGYRADAVTSKQPIIHKVQPSQQTW